MMSEDELLQEAIRLSLAEEKTKKRIVGFPVLYEHACAKCENKTYLFDKKNACSICENKDVVVEECESSFNSSQPRCLCIRPTLGSFAEYINGVSLLHCGITDSQGRVHNFEYQLHIDEKWNQCVNVPLNEGTDELGDKQWDFVLKKHHDGMKKIIQKKPYHELDHNCYDYIVSFLNTVEFKGSSEHTKDSLAKNVLNDPVEHVENYLTVYGAVKTKGSYVVSTKKTEECNEN